MPAITKKKSISGNRLNLRTSNHQAELIRAAALARGMNISQYILENICRQAEQDLADQCHFLVSEEQMKAFMDALDQPPQPKPRMKRLLSEPSILEKK